MNILSDILEAFDKAVQQGQLAEPTVYFAVQRGCLAAMRNANTAQQLALSEGACCAERIGRHLEPYDAIQESDLSYWKGIASHLRLIVELGSSSKSAQEIAFQLSALRSELMNLRPAI